MNVCYVMFTSDEEYMRCIMVHD